MPVSSSIQYPLAPCAGSTYRLKLSLRPAAPGAAEKLSSPTGISISGGNCAGAALCSRLVMRARLSGPSLPSRLPATRVTVSVEATADCVLSEMPSPLPSPVTAPSGPVMPGACSSRASGRPSRSWSSGLDFGVADARGAAGVGAAGSLATGIWAKPAAALPAASCMTVGRGAGAVRIHADTGEGGGLAIDQHGKGAGGALVGGLQGFAVADQQLSGVHGEAVAGACVGVHVSMCASAGRRVSMSKWRTASGPVPGAPASLAVLTLRLLERRCTPLPAVSVAAPQGMGWARPPAQPAVFGRGHGKAVHVHRFGEGQRHCAGGMGQVQKRTLALRHRGVAGHLDGRGDGHMRLFDGVLAMGVRRLGVGATSPWRASRQRTSMVCWLL